MKQMTKEKRDISGIYFRHKNPETNKWENWVFEDLPKERQEEIVKKFEREAVERLAIMLADTLNRICEKFDITAVNPDEEHDE